MKFNYFFQVVKALIKARLFKIKVPLAVSWTLTFCCNRRCLYCAIWKRDCYEMTTSEVLSRMAEFIKLGTKWISFTGGEPLLRDDLGECIEFAKEKGVYVSVSSNGALIPEKIEQLRRVDRIKLSLDGPHSIHDYIRGQGSYDEVMQAIAICGEKRIPVILLCVLSKYNLKSIDYLLKLACRLRLKVLFQPAIRNLLCSEAKNYLSPSSNEYRKVINCLIDKKKKGAPIYNSLSGLHYLYHWPQPQSICCSMGLLGFEVDPDGTILACNREQEALNGVDSSNLDIKEVLRQVKPVLGCNQCWDSSLVEFNLIGSLKFKAIINYLRNC